MWHWGGAVVLTGKEPPGASRQSAAWVSLRSTHLPRSTWQP